MIFFFCDKWLITQFVLFLCYTQWLEVFERTKFFFACIKAFLKQYSNTFDAYANVFSFSNYFKYFSFLLFLRTIILVRCSKVHRLTLILPAKYLSLSDLWIQHAGSIIVRKKWIFMHLYIIRNTVNTEDIYLSHQETASSQSTQFFKFKLSGDATMY